MGKKLELTGQKFHRLTAIKSLGAPAPGKSILWLCECECGNKVAVGSTSLCNGNTKSCGCLNRDRTIQRNKDKTKHGHYVGNKMSPTYQSWTEGKRRCRDPNHHAWDNYGGRGITWPVYWDPFEPFLGDMGERPEGTTLGRIDNNKGYSRENCRWETDLEQGRNRRNVKLSMEKAQEIRNSYKSGESIRMLSQRFGVNRKTIASVLQNKIWKAA